MKARNEKLMQFAQDALTANKDIWYDEKRTSILDAYNGQIAALGVSVAMSGVRPTLAIYYQDKPNAGTRRKANRRTVLNLIAYMLTKEAELENMNVNIGNAEALFRYVVGENANLAWLRKEVIDCSIALKQVVRTYNLVSNE